MIHIFVEMNKNGVISSNIIPIRANKQIAYLTKNIFKDKIIVVTGDSYDIAVTDDMVDVAKDIIILDKDMTGEGVYNSIDELKTYLAPLVDTNDILIIGGNTLYTHFIDTVHVIHSIKIDEYRNIYGVDILEFPDFRKTFALDVVKDLPPLIFNGLLLNYEYNKYIRIGSCKLLK